MSHSEPKTLSPASAWILLEYSKLEQILEQHTQDFEMAHSIDAIYKFLWDYYADWYVEYLKTDDSQIPFAKDLFKQFVITLSPYLPFETEVLWQKFFGEHTLLAFTLKDEAWTQRTLDTHGGLEQLQMKAVEFGAVMDFIQDIRSQRGLFAIDPAIKLEVQTATDLLLKYPKFAELSGRAVLHDSNQPKGYAVRKPAYQYSIDILSYLPDKQKEIERTHKLIADLDKQIGALNAQLNNPQFVAKAGEEVVQDKRQNLSQRELEKTQQLEKLKYLTGKTASED